MKQKLEGRYPAPSDIVIKMMTDKKFYTDRLDLEGIQGYEVVDHKFDGKDFSITTKRKITAISITSIEKWNVAKKTGSIVVELAGMPLELSCKTSLRDDGSDTVMTYDWDIDSKVPLVGGKIEKQFAGENEKAVPQQVKFGVQLLKNYR
jgi:hypothetical protein